MERWGWRVMADKKKKPKLTLVISVGPKMKTKPTDASTPDMKKYGSMPMKKAWGILKNEEPDYEIPEFGDEDARQDLEALEEVMHLPIQKGILHSLIQMLKILLTINQDLEYQETFLEKRGIC